MKPFLVAYFLAAAASPAVPDAGLMEQPAFLVNEMPWRLHMAKGPAYMQIHAGQMTLWRPEKIVDGQLLIVELGFASDCGLPVLTWQEQTYRPRTFGNRARALLPVALGTEPGQQVLRVTCANESSDFAFAVQAGNYSTSKLNVDPMYTRPAPARAAIESANIRTALGESAPEPLWQDDFLRPTEGPITASFGMKRTFNGTLASRHTGVDLEGSLGTPVRAANRGRVVLVAENYYMFGNAVFVDHGAGLSTMYFHLSAMAVKTGDVVEKGDLIGEIGITGRTTGPHLHFAAKIQGVYFNPVDLLSYDPTVFFSAPNCGRDIRR